MQRARRECGTWWVEGVGQTFPLDLVGPANNVFFLRAVETIDGHWAVVRGTWTNQVWKDAPPFFPLNGEASALPVGSCSFSHTQDWASVIGVVILLLHSATSVHFSSTSLIGMPSSKLHTTCHLLLCPRLPRAPGLGSVPFPAPIVRPGDSVIRGEAPANTPTSIPCSPKTFPANDFYLFYSSSSLLWPRSTLHNHSEWGFPWNPKS